MDAAVPRDSDLEFELGGPAYRIMKRLGIIKGAGPSVMRRIVVFIGITWIPLFIFAAMEGHLLGPTPRAAFLLDFATHARIFLAVPLLFTAELVVGPRMRAAGLRFIDAKIIRPESYREFAAAVGRVQRRREAYLPEVAFLIMALAGARFINLEQMTGLTTDNWHTTWQNGELRLSASGLWYRFVAIPLLQFFVLRWVWRLVIWTLFLWEVSRLRLNLLATHTDLSAGLGFLGVAHVSMAIFPFGVGCVIAAEIAFRTHFEGLDLGRLQGMAPLLLAYLVFVEVVTFGPLLIFAPLLAHTRLEALRDYGILVQHHNQLFHDKWINGDRPAGEDALGNQDMSSLVDLGSSYTVVRQMRIVPFSTANILRVASIACMPGLPILFQLLPFTEALKVLAGVLV